MIQKAIFDLAGANSVPGGLEHVVGAPGVPEVSVVVGPGKVTRAAPRPGEFFSRGLGVAPVTDKKDRIGMAVNIGARQGDFANLAGRYRPAFVIDDRYPVAGVGPSHASSLGRPFEVTVADQIVHFGLAEHFVGCDAQSLLAPGENRFADALTRAHDASQGEFEVFTRVRNLFHHELERGREQERVRDPVTLEKLKRLLGGKATAGADDRLAEVQRWQECVHHATCPGPVCRRPEYVSWLRKPVL